MPEDGRPTTGAGCAPALLYRADDPVRLTEEGRRRIAELGLRAVIDLRQQAQFDRGHYVRRRRHHAPHPDGRPRHRRRQPAALRASRPTSSALRGHGRARRCPARAGRRHGRRVHRRRPGAGALRRRQGPHRTRRGAHPGRDRRDRGIDRRGVRAVRRTDAATAQGDDLATDVRTTRRSAPVTGAAVDRTGRGDDAVHRPGRRAPRLARRVAGRDRRVGRRRSNCSASACST